MTAKNSIYMDGVRVNNLKDINVEIPLNTFVVITGLSGSGKSSLAFDTLYAEGQRRYVESLSSYARQFLGRMNKPEVNFIKGIPPAIAIEQKVNSRNPRSTVGTSTEIYEYLRLLFARVGKTISPISGEEVKKHDVEDIIRKMQSYPEGTKYVILTDIHLRNNRTLPEQLEILRKEGFSRIEENGNTIRIEEAAISSHSETSQNTYRLVIDRLVSGYDDASVSRLAQSLETAFFEGEGVCYVRFFTSEKGVEEYTFSQKFEMDGIQFQEPSDLMFSFNSPAGACPACEGFGKVIGIDENLVIPDPSLSIYEGAVACWRGEKMGEWLKEFIDATAHLHYPIHKPYVELSEQDKHLLWKGEAGKIYGIDDFFKMLEENQYKIQYRVMLARYRGKTECPTCKGTRLKPEALYVKVAGRTIAELVQMPITRLSLFFEQIKLSQTDNFIAKHLLMEIRNRLQFLKNVGLGYLTLNRLSNTLSGGESQRINLATSLGSSLVGSLYILDEPSIGLHSRDTYLLIKVLTQLRDIGNTVVVVEHDEEIIRAADHIIDIGPEAGEHGGEIVYQGKISSLKKGTKSHTVQFLCQEDKIETPNMRRTPLKYISIMNATQNNLKNITVSFPLGVMCVVTGVSGSGKSSLVRDVLVNALRRHLGEPTDHAPQCRGIDGDLDLVQRLEAVDQNPIGKSSRSNPVTYMKAFDEIRKLFALQPLAKQRGYTPSHFSFNMEGGRCPECKGDGTISVEMQFMADITLECELCHGRRFREEILEVKYRDKNIFDILEMTVSQAIDFFSQETSSIEKKIVKRLTPLFDVGLGYIRLGQSSSTLSGGENQRVKLAFYLGEEKSVPTLFIFDEPTTGLHFYDIKILLSAFQALIQRGHSLLIIEHNMDVIKCADHIIDVGPEGGDKGGEIICEGTPEEVAQCKKSYTGQFLKEKLKQ